MRKRLKKKLQIDNNLNEKNFLKALKKIKKKAGNKKLSIDINSYGESPVTYWNKAFSKLWG